MARRAGHDLTDEGLFAGHRMDFANFGQALEFGRKRIVGAVRRRIQADECGQFEAEPLRIELGRIALNVSALLETFDAIVDRRSSQANQGAQLGECRASVGLQGIEQPEVEFV